MRLRVSYLLPLAYSNSHLNKVVGGVQAWALVKEREKDRRVGTICGDPEGVRPCRAEIASDNGMSMLGYESDTAVSIEWVSFAEMARRRRSVTRP